MLVWLAEPRDSVLTTQGKIFTLPDFGISHETHGTPIRNS